jgi:hypothetical protein
MANLHDWLKRDVGLLSREDFPSLFDVSLFHARATKTQNGGHHQRYGTPGPQSWPAVREFRLLGLDHDFGTPSCEDVINTSSGVAVSLSRQIAPHDALLRSCP